MANFEIPRLLYSEKAITSKEKFIMTRSYSESQEHQSLISMMVHHFESEGYKKIKADIPGRTKPAIIYGTKRNHITDLTSKKNGTFVILEAETSIPSLMIIPSAKGLFLLKLHITPTVNSILSC